MKSYIPLKIIDFSVKLSLVMLFCILFAGCGGGTGEIPLETLKKTLRDQPTFSVLLDDMKEEGTFVKNYFHRYLVVLPDESSKTQWFQVPKEYYNKNIDFLGMTLLTKKEGAYDDAVSPPGYGFVGDENYGRWRDDGNGGSFWEFYGKYALISSLFGGWYSPIHRHDYRSYQSYRSKRKPFFGSSKQYGSSGKIVKATRPTFYSSRMSSVNAKKSSFSNKVSQKIGRTKTGLRSRAGGSGK
ncbi:hypothetical protein SAMN02746065_10756 [Desulfocicer vacuolatum DSM 3385]|uniref:DUF4247 domain-containing protein n=1 Tax=Desulfocicer vacuolatum DSM 3385 TaxID=1121400 RepID=A0A1W2B7N0_9BACT|nr:hypothetical protein [Desulfocicer vacuolatum]SMC68977.1 hypothetical protein SAMN02746065_10756 [Desulfocicer vacuolatum DSM 3385]